MRDKAKGVRGQNVAKNEKVIERIARPNHAKLAIASMSYFP
jgi:hypothetical protein